MSDQYYTASQAMAKLGLSKAMFHRKVNQGLIPKVTPPGKKQSVYPKRDIDALARAMNLVFEQHDRIVFSKSTPADQEEEMRIGIRCLEWNLSRLFLSGSLFNRKVSTRFGASRSKVVLLDMFRCSGSPYFS